ncbi:MAG: carbamoyltransferase HypF [Deltaproteobacteria bacterium]|nr:carbamoyltransferase HypF [Deltaproteobacteria bacterium]
MVRRMKISIQGTVQGIGFRPFVFNLARRNHLNGYVTNTSEGVEIEVEGESDGIELFLNAIEQSPPPLAHITDIIRTPIPLIQEEKFVIRQSRAHEQKIALIPPDVSICKECLRELRDPADRRYRYPFINCVNCGPRFTIIEDIPYDRPNTSMQAFLMCADCLAEYYDPDDRRFHAQPNACPVCGPQVSLYDNRGTRLLTDEPIVDAIELLKRGAILAVKGLGGFHLAVDAENDAAVKSLRHRKHREDKPFALMSLDVDRIRRYAHVDRGEASLLMSPVRPIILLDKKEPNSISTAVSPGLRTFGVMLPYTPLHYLLLESDLLALVMTSGNRSKEPLVVSNAYAFKRLGTIADYILLHNRDIRVRADDSIVRRIGGQTRLIRRSRGYVPTPIFLTRSFPQILACGAETANTICLTKGKNAFVSQHIGDLENLESLIFFEKTIEHFKRLFDIWPEVVTYDLHPDYLSSRYARQLKSVRLIGVQHHHAHIASCMTENGIEGPVIGLAFDGTGYGTDGRIWGGEVLLTRPDRFRRLAHLEYVPMPGGAAAVKEPWRMAVSYLLHAYGDDLWKLNLPIFTAIDKNKIRTVLDMIKRGVNCPQTSSLGRLFDGVSTILGIRYRSSYEGQAAVELEMAMDAVAKGPFAHSFVKENGLYRIPVKPIIRGVADDFMSGQGAGNISYRFHMTLIHLFSDLCETLRQETGINQVVLSGGVFQNAVMLEGLENSLNNRGFRVFSHTKVPCNDGGISLGQAAVAEASFTLRKDSHVSCSSHENLKN